MRFCSLTINFVRKELNICCKYYGKKSTRDNSFILKVNKIKLCNCFVSLTKTIKLLLVEIIT